MRFFVRDPEPATVDGAVTQKFSPNFSKFMQSISKYYLGFSKFFQIFLSWFCAISIPCEASKPNELTLPIFASTGVSDRSAQVHRNRLERLPNDKA